MPHCSRQTVQIASARKTSNARSLALIAAGLALSGTPLRAESRIGNTALAKNEVSQIAASQAKPISLGDDVFMNEQVKTGLDSAAKFVFSDQTNLALGPTSLVKLDRFVYKGDTSYAKATVNFAAGAFRFTTGGSDKGAYQLKTSTATIGVRGTIFELSVARGVTNLTLVEGEVVICPRANFDGDPRKLSKAKLGQFHCQDLTQPNQTARVTARKAALSSTPVNFAGNFCAGGGGLCSVSSTVATAEPVGNAPLDPNNPALCYANPDPD
ncbi:FecR family protein [Lichenifustis flavocetrariae]|uniref:FecR family protein n=1 Tax=Lichenifustis flavocetrariae TaxID=2949735 RepID=A0AA41YZ78_9HYPH|nr:FecR family protein [Lichenifustis flavocetrariae]MCW6507583.1 FecR family protein [Lichenifustis flavocetrariae]